MNYINSVILRLRRLTPACCSSDSYTGDIVITATDNPILSDIPLPDMPSLYMRTLWDDMDAYISVGGTIYTEDNRILIFRSKNSASAYISNMNIPRSEVEIQLKSIRAREHLTPLSYTIKY